MPETSNAIEFEPIEQAPIPFEPIDAPIPFEPVARSTDSVPAVAPTEDPNAVEAREQTAKAEFYGNAAQALQNLNPAIGIPNLVTSALRAIGVPETEAPNITPEIVQSTPLLTLPNFSKKNWLRPFTTQQGINEQISGGEGAIPESDPVLNIGLGVYDAMKDFAEGMTTANMLPGLIAGGPTLQAIISGSSIAELPTAFQHAGAQAAQAEADLAAGKPVDFRAMSHAFFQAGALAAIGTAPGFRAILEGKSLAPSTDRAGTVPDVQPIPESPATTEAVRQAAIEFTAAEPVKAVEVAVEPKPQEVTNAIIEPSQTVSTPAGGMLIEPAGVIKPQEPNATQEIQNQEGVQPERANGSQSGEETKASGSDSLRSPTEGQQAPVAPTKWTAATSESGFVLDPVAIAKEVVRRVKEVGGYLKAAGEKSIELAKDIKEEQFELNKVGDYRKAVLNWSAKLQKSFQEAHDAQRDIRAIFKDPVRDEAAYAWLEAEGDAVKLADWAARSTDPKRKAAYEAALTLTPKEIDMARAVRGTFDELAVRGLREGVLQNFRENYVTHLWDLGKKPKGSASRPLQENLKYAKARTFETSFEGEQAGLTPKTKKLSEVVPIYINEMNSVIAARQLAAELQKGKASDKLPLVQMQGEGIPVTGAGGQATLVMPDMAKKSKVKYETLPNQPALHDWIWAAKDSAGNPIFLKADMALHPEAFSKLRNVLGKSALRQWYNSEGGAAMTVPKAIVKGIDATQSEFKRTMLGFVATFHQVQEAWHGLAHRIIPIGREKIDLQNNPVQLDYAKHGLMIYPDRASESHYMEGFRHSGLVSRIPVIGRVSDMYSHFLFHEFIPEMKVKTMKAIVERNMKVFGPELARGEVTPTDVKVLSAEQVNAAYGHLNYADLGRSPTVQHFLQLGLLAPDFLEARTRFAAQAAKGATGAKVGREQALAIATIGLFQAAAAYTLANFVGGVWDEKHPFEFRKGNRTYTMRSVPEDLLKFAEDPRAFIHNRVSPLVGKAALEVWTGKDWRGEKVGPTDIVKELAQSWIPLNIRPFTPAARSSLEPWEQLAGSMGFKISYYSAQYNVFKLAHEFKKNSGDPKLIAEAKREEKETLAASDYTPLRRALENQNKSEAQKEYSKLLETKKPIQIREAMQPNKPLTGSRKLEYRFVKSLDDEQKAIYVQALETRKLIWNRFIQMRSEKATPVSDIPFQPVTP